jgi:hypothetical protein
MANAIVSGGISNTRTYIRANPMIDDAIPTVDSVHAVRPPADGFTTDANIPASGTRYGIIRKLEYVPIAGYFSNTRDSKANHAAR